MSSLEKGLVKFSAHFSTELFLVIFFFFFGIELKELLAYFGD